MKRSLSLVTVALAAAVAAACGSSSSTAPKILTPAELASHFDSIYSSVLAGGSDTDSVVADYVAAFVESPAAFGASPVSVPVTTGAGTQTWSGYGFQYVSASDSFFIAAVYPSPSLQDLVLVEWDLSSTPTEVYAVAFANHFADLGDDSTATGAASVAVLGTGSCTLQTGLAADSLLTGEFGGNTCTPITFTANATLTFPTADVLGSLSTVSFPSTTFNGERFSGGNEPSRTARIPSVAAARIEHLRDLIHHLHH